MAQLVWLRPALFHKVELHQPLQPPLHPPPKSNCRQAPGAASTRLGWAGQRGWLRAWCGTQTSGPRRSRMGGSPLLATAIMLETPP